MSRPYKGHGIEDEPHYSGEEYELDPSEDPAAANVEETETWQPEAEKVEQSVWDEPGISARLTGNRPVDATTYAGWLDAERARITVGYSLLITILIAAAAGPWSLLGALLGTYQGDGQILVVCVFAPMVEEMMKVGLALWAVEKRPFWFKSPLQIVLCAAAAGLVFAVIENFMYLGVYIQNPGAGIIAWRWTVCVGLHTGCSVIASIGLVRIWNRVWDRRERAELHHAFPFIITAVVVHAVYNTIVTLASLSGFDF